MTEVSRFSLETPEYAAVLAANEVDPSTPRHAADPWVETHTQIVELFTGIDPNTGARVMISPSRIAGIAAITARRQAQVWNARGELSRAEIIAEWAGNKPQDYGRHPDLLFDMAQINFGHDRPVLHIELSVMQLELERRELAERYALYIRKLRERYPDEFEED